MNGQPYEAHVAVVSCEDTIETEGALVINVEPSCKRGFEGAVTLEYPLSQLTSRPPEELNELALTALRFAKAGSRVIIVGLGEDDDRPCYLANALLVALKGQPLLQCSLSRAQEQTLNWYARLKELIGLEQLHALFGVGKAYEFGSGLEHASTVANISLDLAQAVSRGTLTHRYLKSLYVAGLLHDIGRFVSERGHEEIGVRMLMAHKDALPGDVDVDLISFCIRHHRRHTNPENDPAVESLGENGLILAAVVRLADAFTNVYEKEDYWGVYLSEDGIAVVARRVNKERFESKGKLLEKITGVKVTLRQPG
ncbi:MAG: HD domain-containing protein [Thermofilaceae archaeon]